MAKKKTADPTVEQPANTNKVNITDIGPCLKKISIEIPADAVKEQLGSSLDTIVLEAELPGFRKGHAPKRLIEKRFGSGIRKEAKNQLVASAYSRAIEDSKLRVIGDPSSEMLQNVELEDGKPLAFDIEVEVMPEFELPPLTGVKIMRPTLEVTDKMVDDELARLGLHEGELQERESPEPADYLTGHAVMKDSDGKTLLDIHDAVIQVPPPDKNGKGMILGIAVDDFATQLALPKPGMTATIKTKGPEGHETESVRGKDLTITFRVSRVDRIIPASVASLVTKYGMESETQLRDTLKERITGKIRVDQSSAMRQQVARLLMDSVKIELPERVTAAQASRNLSRRRMELIYRGLDPAQIDENLAGLRQSAAGDAVRDLKLFFIMTKAAESMDIKVSNSEMEQRIAQMAWQRNMRPDRLRSEILRTDGGSSLFTQIREHKTMDAILGTADVEDVSTEEFNKRIEEMTKKA